MMYLALLAIIAIEYVGIGPLKPLPLPLSMLLLVYVLAKYPLKDFWSYRQSKLMAFFIFLTAAGLLHGLIQRYAMQPMEQQIGYFILMFVMFYLLDRTRRFDLFAILIVAAFAYMCVINMDKFMTSVRRGYFTAGYFMGDGNDFAWGLNFALPFALYLFLRFKNSLLIRLGAGAAAALIVFGIIGTQSRGASLAMAAAFLYVWLFVAKSKTKGLLVVGILGLGVLAFAPAYYFDRMSTVTDYEEDTSAMGRIRAWGTAIEMAIDHPVLGVGAGSFNSAYGRLYRQADGPVRWISTHSVYFKILGEYGFTGIIVWVSLLWSNFTANLRTRRLLDAHPGKTDIPPALVDMINMSLVGYSVAAMFLSGVSYPHIFLLTALTMAVQHNVRRQLAVETGRPHGAAEPQPAVFGAAASRRV